MLNVSFNPALPFLNSRSAQVTCSTCLFLNIGPFDAAPSRGTQLCLATWPCRTAQHWGQPCTNKTLWYGHISENTSWLCIQACLCDRVEGPTAQLRKEAHPSPPDKEPSTSTPQEDLSWFPNVKVIDHLKSFIHAHAILVLKVW